jgi:hypothetical protein
MSAFEDETREVTPHLRSYVPLPAGIMLQSSENIPPQQYLQQVISWQKKEKGYRAGSLAGNRKAKKLFAPGVNSGPFVIQSAKDAPSTVCLWGKHKFTLSLNHLLYPACDHRRRLKIRRSSNSEDHRISAG